LPHTPQLALLVLRFVSQPLLRASPSQLPQPELHEMEQEPSAHDAVPLALLHGWLQPPQCRTVVCVFVSQPLAALLSQLP
jgi:hypothetical protein